LEFFFIVLTPEGDNVTLREQ